MPICFQLYEKANPEQGPVVLQKVDEEMCAHFGVPCDPEKWLNGWYGVVGFQLACGKSYGDIREKVRGWIREDSEKPEALEYDNSMMMIVDYLEEKYTTNSYYSPFKD